jgi:glycosyltransferase involved in cell wall biosynthesis
MIEPEDIPKKIQEHGPSDIVVGIASFNDIATIEHVVRIVLQGLQEHFPSLRSVIVHADGGSEDGTPGRVLNTVTDSGKLIQIPYRHYPARELIPSYHGVPGKANALSTIFRAAQALEAKACALVGSDLRSITPDWIRRLIRPVVEENVDFVAPYYLRHKYDGAMTNSIVYPMIRALYGRRIRHPIGGEFCFSPALIDYCLRQDTWASDAAQLEIDIWLTIEALCGGFRSSQVYLGEKVHDSKDASTDLSGVLVCVLGSLFSEMEKKVKVWQRVRGSEAVPMYGEPVITGAESVHIDVEKLIDSYNLGFRNLIEIWNLVMSPATLLELKRLTRRDNGSFRFPDDVWVHIVYDFAVAYHLRTINRDHLLGAFAPLYLGWIASFILQMQSSDAVQMETRIEELCLRYEAEKPYLISRWRWPDRFNP